MNSRSNYSELRVHLLDESRRQQLLTMEKNLVEHNFPPQLIIENTSICNLRCIHCSHKEMIRKQKSMERSLWNKIVEEIGRQAPECEVWPTFYGEALVLGDELWDRLDYAKEVGCRNLVLNSNATLLSRNDNIDKVLASPLKRFILSLDGLSKEVFEKIRVNAKWDQVYPSVIELCQRRIHNRQTYPVIIAQFSLMKENAAEAEDYHEFWQKQGAEVKIRPMLEWGAAGSIRTETIRHDSDFRIACPWANSTMAVHQDGTVVACAVDYEGRLVAGNLNEQSIAEVWSKLKNMLREPHKEHRWADIPEICKGCGDWQVAGAYYDEEAVEGTRPFWYYQRGGG